jgi:hypothetical protein
VTARRIWSEWKNSLIVVTPETVVGTHSRSMNFASLSAEHWVTTMILSTENNVFTVLSHYRTYRSSPQISAKENIPRTLLVSDGAPLDRSSLRRFKGDYT